MYKELDYKVYGSMSNEQKILELRKWVEDQFANCRATLRAIAYIPDDDPDILTVIKTPFKDLPKLINDYDEGSVQHMILKYRLDNNIVTGDVSLLDINIIGKITAECCGDSPLTDEDTAAICHNRAVIDELRTICKIFGFMYILEDLIIWRP